MTTLSFLTTALRARIPAPALQWLDTTAAEVASGLEVDDFCARLSLASRQVPRGPLAPTEAERTQARALDPGFEPERWTLLEAGRVMLILSRPDLDGAAGAAAIEEAFRYADEGELRALYRSLAHLPAAERFAWRAGEGCRSNMRSVFEAAACDTSFPVRHFDDVAWRQALIKAVFVEAPLWRIWGLDDRLDAETARMALDLAEERRAAHRKIQPELWLCLGEHAGARGLESLQQELDPANPHRAGRLAATWALGRAGDRDRLQALADADPDPMVREAANLGLAGPVPQTTYSNLERLADEAGVK